MIPKPLIGPRGKIPILLRDDDTNYFTDKRMLESVYAEAWNQGFKVSFSVVPLQRGIDDIAVPPGSRESSRCYSIADNESLIRYIRKKIENKAVEVVQHGLSHELIDGIRGEFGGNLGKNVEIEKGRNILRQAFETEPKFFVPPGEDISNQNIMAVLEQGLVPIYRDTLFDRILRIGFVPNLVKNAGMRLVMNTYNNDTDENFGVQFLKPVLISVRKGAITWSLPKARTSHITSFDSLFNLTNCILKLCRRNRFPVCIINHYHLYYYDWSSTITKDDLFTAWRNIVSSFDKMEIGWKTTFLELYNRLEKIRRISMAKTGSKITIKADTFINDFSFQTGKPLETNSMVTSDEGMNIVTLDELSPNSNFIFYEKD
jgi:peptidoglycan/xylan/chitin deacetylase (PgdA/CDA1 family)